MTANSQSFESNTLPVPIEATNLEQAIPCSEVLFEVKGVKDSVSSELYFDVHAPNPLDLNLLGASLSFLQLNEVEGATKDKKTISVEVFPGDANRVDMFCHVRENEQDCVTLVNVYDRITDYRRKIISLEQFEVDSDLNRLSTFIFRITGPDGKTYDVLTKTVLENNGKFDEDEEGRPTPLFNMKNLVVVGITSIIQPTERLKNIQ